MRKLPYDLAALGAAIALAGCASQHPSPQADYTYCSRYSDAPECSGMRPAPAAAVAPAPAPARPAAAAPAPAAAQERTVVVTSAGPPPNRPGECYTKVVLPAQF